MKRTVAVLVAAAALSTPGLAQANDLGGNAPQAQDQGKVVASTTVAESALVRAVDLANRTITLQLADGTVQTFAVGPQVQRLAEVHPGDTVNTTYSEAVSVKLNKTRVPAGVVMESTVRPDEQSPTPAGAAGTRVTTTATITRIYDDGKKVTLRFPDGSSSEVAVQDPENLAMIRRGEVKPGDQITITYVRAVAISVDKAPPR